MITPTLNSQPIEAPDRHENGFLEIHHVWETIQGEGPFAGLPAVFVRLTGCNLQCPLCDTDYTSQRTTHSPSSAFDIISKTSQRETTRLVVLTGGEPLRQNVVPLIKLLTLHDYIVQIETNGAYHLPGLEHTRATVVCSPKTPKINPKLIVHAYKYILEHQHVCPDDGLPTSVLGGAFAPARPPAGSRDLVWVQPADEQDPEVNKLNRDAAVTSCFRHGYRLCLQTHKLLGLE